MRKRPAVIEIALFACCSTAVLGIAHSPHAAADQRAEQGDWNRVVLPAGSKIAVAPLRSTHYVRGVNSVTEVPQWDVDARNKYGVQIVDAIERSGFEPVLIDAELVDGGRGFQVSELAYAVVKAVDQYGSGRNATLMGKTNAADWSIGSGVSTIAPESSDYVLFAFLTSTAPNTGAVVTGIVGGLVAGASMASMASSHREARALLVDAATGDVIWSGYKFGTLASPRTEDGAESFVAIVFTPAVGYVGWLDLRTVVPVGGVGR